MDHGIAFRDRIYRRSPRSIWTNPAERSRSRIADSAPRAVGVFITLTGLLLSIAQSTIAQEAPQGKVSTAGFDLPHFVPLQNSTFSELKPGDPSVAARGRELAAYFTERTKPVHTIACSPDGKLALIVWDDGRPAVLDLETGNSTILPFDPNLFRPNCAAIALDNRHALLDMQLWDLETQKLVKTLPADGPPRDLAFHPDPKFAISISAQGVLEVWDLDKGAVIARDPQAHGDRLALAPSASRVVLGREDQKFALWRCRNRLEKYFESPGTVGYLADAAFSPTDSICLLASRPGQVVLFNTDPPGPKRSAFSNRVLPSTNAPQSATAFSPQGVYGVVYMGDDQVQYFHIKSALQAGDFGQFKLQTNAVAIVPGCRRGLCGYGNGSVTLWELPPPAPERISLVVAKAKRGRDGLTKAFNDLRKNPALTTAGASELSVLIDTVVRPTMGTRDHDATIADMKAWAKADETAVLPRLCLVEQSIEAAWEARGGAPAAAVPPAAWELFNKHMAAAKTSLDEAEQLDSKIDWIYEKQIVVELALGGDKARALRIFDDALKNDSPAPDLFRQMASFLLPRWHGAPGEVGQFAARTADKLGPGAGDLAYADFAQCVAEMEGVDRLTASGFDFDRAKTCSFVAAEKFPSSIWRQLFAVALACKVRDQDAARTVFLRLGRRGQAKFGLSKSALEHARQWAVEPPPATNAKRSITAQFGRLTGLEFLVGGDLSVVCGETEPVQIFRNADGIAAGGIPVLNERLMIGLVASPDGSSFLTSGTDQRGQQPQVRLWELKQGKLSAEVLEEISAPMHALAFSSDSKRFAGGDDQGRIQVWQVGVPKPVATMNTAEHLMSLAFAAGDKQIASARVGGPILLHDIESGELNASIDALAAPIWVVRALQNRLIAGGADCRPLAYDLETKNAAFFGSQEYPTEVDRRSGQIKALAVSSFFVAAAVERFETTLPDRDRFYVDVYRAQDGRHVSRLFGHEGPITGISILPGNKTLVSVGWDGRMLFFDLPATEIGK